MKYFTPLCIAFLFILLISSISNAQLVKFGIGGGLTAINSPDIYTKSIGNGGYGFSSNYHFTALLKLDIPLVPITPGVFIDYHVLRGSGSTALGNVNTSQNIFTVGAEGQYNIFPLPFAKPYAEVDLAYNNFGDINYTDFSGTYAMAGNSRFGAALGVGVVISAIPSMDLDVSAKYHFMNLVGKQSGESNINAATLNLILLF